jgi:hypothetical protein
MRGEIGVARCRRQARHCRDGKRCQWPEPNAPRYVTARRPSLDREPPSRCGSSQHPILAIGGKRYPAIGSGDVCPPKAKVTRSNRVGCANDFSALRRIALQAILLGKRWVSIPLQCCALSDNLRLIRLFEKGDSGSSGLGFRRPATDAASVGLRYLLARCVVAQRGLSRPFRSRRRQGLELMLRDSGQVISFDEGADLNPAAARIALPSGCGVHHRGDRSRTPIDSSTRPSMLS